MREFQTLEQAEDWVECRAESGLGVPMCATIDGAIHLIRSFNGGECLLSDMGFKFNGSIKLKYSDGTIVFGAWQRCRHCHGLGRVDCCERLDCEKCNGLSSAWCEHCEDGQLQISIDQFEKYFKERYKADLAQDHHK